MNTERLHRFKSSCSGGEGGACVEVATCPTTWSAFVTYTQQSSTA